MKVSYGSDEQAYTTFVRRVPAVRRLKSKMKSVLGAVGVTLFVGCAFVAYQSSSESISSQYQASTKQEQLNLEAMEMPVSSILQSGATFQLRVLGKNNLCMDDGGGTLNGQTKFQLWGCDPLNINQLFTYDVSTMQIRSSTKVNMCVDDGGGYRAGESKLTLWTCDPSNKNQKFEYLASSQMFRNPTKPNLCIDDGGATYNGQVPFVLWDCAETNGNQHFEVLPLPSSGYVVPDYLRNRQPIVIFIGDKPGLCVDDGGGVYNAQTKFTNKKCNANGVDQVFVYNPDTFQFQSLSKPNMCLDDGGGTNPGETTFHLWDCHPMNTNQRFIYEESTQHIINPTKNLCMDDGGGTRPGETLYSLQKCQGPEGKSQHFAILWQSESNTVIMQPPEVDAWAVDNPILLRGEEFIMRATGKGNLCVDDGGGIGSGHTKFQLWTCDQSNMNQVFRYDPATFSIRSVSKSNLCVDDGGGVSAAQTQFTLWTCDPSNNNQKFVYDSSTQMFRNPTKHNMCMDDGGGTASGQTKFVLWDCAAHNDNQHFEIHPRLHAPVPILPELVTYPVPDYLKSQQPVVIYVVEKPGLCVDDGGGWHSGETKILNQDCNPSGSNQLFKYDAENYQFRSVMKPNMCLDDGGGSVPDETTFHLWECHPLNNNQRFIYDEKYKHIVNPTKNLCMTDGGGVHGGAPVYSLQYCGGTNEMNQHFSILWQSVVTGPTTPEGQSQTTESSTYETTSTSKDDWNLLSPSHQTVHAVNVDKSDQITSEEIFQYLNQIKNEGELLYSQLMYKYQRTSQCVSAGLAAFAKTSVTQKEYHDLVSWMYSHCQNGSNYGSESQHSSDSKSRENDTPDNIEPVRHGSWHNSETQQSNGSGSGSESGSKHMTKLEFYQKIKEHFSAAREEMVRSAEGVNLRSQSTMDLHNKLTACIEEASTRFGGSDEYSSPEKFHKAVEWVNESCMKGE